MLISADSHVIERPSILEEFSSSSEAPFLPKELPNGVDIPFQGSFPIDTLGCAGRDPDFQNQSWDNLHQGGWDPLQRPRDVEYEVLYPSIGMMVLSNPRSQNIIPYCKVYNRWMKSLTDGGKWGLIGLGLCSYTTTTQVEKEINQIKEGGLSGIILPGSPSSFDLDDYWECDWFWDLVSEVGLPVHFHSMTGESVPLRGPAYTISQASIYGMQQLMGSLVWGGVMERHPDVRIVFAEADAGWVNWWCQKADNIYYRHRNWTGVKLPNPPSFYVSRNCYFTFGDDVIGSKNKDCMNFMWASDWPHLDAVSTLTAICLDEDSRWECAARLYGIEVA